MTVFLRGLWKSEGKSLCDAFFCVFVTQTAMMFNDVAQTLILFILLDSRSISYEKLPTFFLFFNHSACFPHRCRTRKWSYVCEYGFCCNVMALPFVVFCKRRSLHVIQYSSLSEHERRNYKLCMWIRTVTFFNRCFSVHFDNYKTIFCQQMHCSLKHKMLQFVLKISLSMAPACFGPSWTIIREHTMEPC